MINGREITWDNIDDVLLKISQLEEVGIRVNSSHVAIMQYLESFHFKYIHCMYYVTASLLILCYVHVYMYI